MTTRYARTLDEYRAIQRSLRPGAFGPIDAPMVYLSANAPVPRRPVTLPTRSATIAAPTSDRLVGFTAPYGVEARNERGERFMFARGCFDGSLTLLQCYLNHDESKRLGGSKDRSLHVVDRSDGLHFSLALSSPCLSTQDADALTRLAQSGQLTSASPGWVERHRYFSEASGLWIVTRAELYEISILTARERPRFSGSWVRFERAAA